MKENTLEKQFLDGNITVDEIAEFRRQLNSEPDEVVTERMRERWMNEDIDVTQADADEMDTIWKKITMNIKPAVKNYALRKTWKWLQIAAVLLLPVLIISSLFLYHQNSILASSNVTITTGAAERAGITLPDGTKVALNENTTLKYNASTFNTEHRQITFDGEGYFEVHKDPAHPFSIDADRLNVKVLGTVFNLRARNADAIAEINLAKGKVMFTSLITNKYVNLNPNQKAVLDKRTGAISVENLSDGINESTAWKRKEMVFRNMPLSVVINTLEKTFNVDIRIRNNTNLTDLYTGTMSSTDINVDLKILERLYHLKSRMQGESIIIEQ